MEAGAARARPRLRSLAGRRSADAEQFHARCGSCRLCAHLRPYHTLLQAGGPASLLSGSWRCCRVRPARRCAWRGQSGARRRPLARPPAWLQYCGGLRLRRGATGGEQRYCGGLRLRRGATGDEQWRRGRGHRTFPPSLILLLDSLWRCPTALAGCTLSASLITVEPRHAQRCGRGCKAASDVMSRPVPPPPPLPRLTSICTPPLPCFPSPDLLCVHVPLE